MSQFDITVDRVIHAAAVNETLISTDLKSSYEVNVTLTRLLMEMSKNNQIAEFVYISTFHIYGKDRGLIDKGTPILPKNDYGLTHYLSEIIVESLGKSFGVNTLTVRPTNIYAIPQDLTAFNRWTLVPFDFVRSAVNDGAIILRSSGMQERNFVDASDVVSATHLIKECETVDAYGNDTLTIRAFALLVAGVVEQEIDKKVNVDWVGDDTSYEKLSFNENDLYKPEAFIGKFIKDLIRIVE